MATIIKIKRSSGTSTPNLGQGELGYSWGTANYTDAQSANVTSYGKMFLGTGTETGGAAANIEIIGGKYFTDMLDHGHGTLTANSAVIVDSASKINVWNVDNLRLDANTISSTDTDGDINLDPNGAGEIVIPDDTYLTFGTSKDTKIKYDEATDDRLEVTGADWNFASGVAIQINDTTVSSNSGSGALIVTGGVGIGGNLNVAGSITAGSLATPANFTVSGDLTVQGGDINVTEVATNINIKDATSGAFVVKEGTNQYINITTSDSAEKITIGNNLSSVDVVVEDNVASAFVVKEGTNEYIKVTTTNGSELITLNTSNVVVANDLAVNGGDLTTTQSTFNLINSTATTVNFAGAATTLNIGSASTEVDFGDLRIVGSTIYSDNSGSQTITLDPYPAGGNGGGNVVVRGNLQVSGTTTTVNSTQMTINDPIFTLGDSISEKTVVSAASSGQADVVLDDVEGLNVGDIVSGNAAIPNGTTISVITSGTKTITLSANLTAGIAASTNTSPKTLVFTQGADDNKDRGIEFKYFNSSLKTGFFGYDESGITEDVVNYYFTYIPDATNTNNVFTGTVGSAYFKTVKLDDGVLNGVAFFDQYKRLTRTVAAGTSDATTSNQILTVNGSGVPVWTTTLDGGTY